MSKEEIAQWVIDNRYPKSELNKVSDHELYYALVEQIEKYSQQIEREAADKAKQCMVKLILDKEIHTIISRAEKMADRYISLTYPKI